MSGIHYKVITRDKEGKLKIGRAVCEFEQAEKVLESIKESAVLMGEELISFELMTAIKRYLVFEYSMEEPQGGWDDLVGMADNEEEAIALIKSRWNLYRIIDTRDLNRHVLRPQDERMIRGK